MRRFALLMVEALLMGMLLGGVLEAQTPGTLVVNGEFLSATGCLAFLNNSANTKKCSFTIVLPGVKVTDLACNSTSVVDTIINCTYSTIEKLDATYTAPTNTAGGTILLPVSYDSLSDGCFSTLNHPALRCGFNINLVGVALQGLTLTTKVCDGDTELEASYPVQLQVLAEK
jgi:hypothetical protein